jgi:hydrogenase maturation protein HypF
MSKREHSGPVTGLRLSIRGSVQGVGFRPWLWRSAHRLGLRGRVRNVPGGVAAELFGSPEALAELRGRLDDPPLPGARVESVEARPLDGAAPPRLEIVDSGGAAAPGAGLGVAADLPTCVACLDDVADPASRRHRYPFTACAACGPRYTMARDLPWDRARTAMADFALCAACAREYADPDDRRFHAEATACPACGPSLRARPARGEGPVAGEQALAGAVASLRAGGVVAVQGIGGFHLACDARDAAAVARLRERKRRARKPLAVMVATLADAEKLAWIDVEARARLACEARPIVLLPEREGSGLAPGVAPDVPLVGLLLPYTPLHALLLADFGGPLVMTSANRSGEPIAHRPEADADALAALADRVLAHDREIVAPCDDSVVLPALGAPIVLRRSRGFVPRPVRLARPVRRTVLACGGQWSNTICLARGDRAWPGPHVGDLDSPEAATRFAETVAHWLSLTGAEPELVAHDLHPGYETTRFALGYDGARSVGVQHHHAHLAAVLGEHGVAGPALGLLWDGTGWGGDGSAWGGELLLGDASAFRRLATFRPIPLAGGERAIREPWRLALALLDDAFDGAAPTDALALFARVGDGAVEEVRKLLAAPGLCPPAHGVGRYFDAVGALLLVRPSVTFQGELAQALGFLGAGRDASSYPFALERGQEPWQIDLRPAVRRLVRDLLLAQREEGPDRSDIAARFHATLVAAGEAAVRAGLHEAGREVPVALGGGCFANPRLVEGLERRLAPARVLRPVELPPGDGGLALGQALVADAQVDPPTEG